MNKEELGRRRGSRGMLIKSYNSANHIGKRDGEKESKTIGHKFCKHVLHFPLMENKLNDNIDANNVIYFFCYPVI